MKKRNGFTLVELLAVIVVLAIIMIIAIPSVLEVMNSARRSSFALYVDKVTTAVQTQYMYDANMGTIAGKGFYVYDITQDLNLTSTGEYKGYVVVDAIDVDNPRYVVFLYDKNYQLLNYDVSTNGMPEANSTNIQSYDPSRVSSEAGTSVRACQQTKNAYEDDATKKSDCYNRKGYVITEGA